VAEVANDSREFEARYRALYPLVVRTVYLVIFDRDVAQEITNEAFLRLWQHRDRLAVRGNDKAWLMRVAVNLAIDYRRSLFTALRHRPTYTPAFDPANAAIDQLERDDMRRALRRLPRRDRALLALRFEQDLSFPEIGQLFGRPEATVKTWVHRALDRLQRDLKGKSSPALEES
jgi:RNA polymerase sigma-70 factor, ECF subfamily